MTVETIASKNPTYNSWWSWRPLLLELWGGPASCRLEQLSCAVCPTWVCNGRRQSLGRACESSPPAVLYTLKMSATSAGDSDLRFLMISTLVSGLILGMLTEAMLSINWWLKVSNFCFYSTKLPTIWLIMPFVCFFLFHYGLEIGAMPLRQDFCPAKKLLCWLLSSSKMSEKNNNFILLASNKL